MIVPEAEFIVPWEERERCVIVIALDNPLLQTPPVEGLGPEISLWKAWSQVSRPGVDCSDQRSELPWEAVR